MEIIAVRNYARVRSTRGLLKKMLIMIADKVSLIDYSKNESLWESCAFDCSQPCLVCSLFPRRDREKERERERLAARGEFELAISACALYLERGAVRARRTLQKFATAVTLHLFVRAHTWLAAPWRVRSGPIQSARICIPPAHIRLLFGPLFFVANQDFSLLTCHLQTKYA